jgi:S-disulfanyl-L-cysteine oxidoreductase SoxD
MLRPRTIASIAAVAFFTACHSHERRAADASFRPASFADQVARGQTLFAENCAKCHGDAGEGGTGDIKAPRLVGLAQGALPIEPPADRQFRKTRFVTVGDVADFAMAYMPPKKAGILADEEYLAVIAFDLQANGIKLDAPLTVAKAKELVIPR